MNVQTAIQQQLAGSHGIIRSMVQIKGATGEYPLGWALSVLIAQHAAAHSGEIAALKGVQGLKGLPF